jgi:hypothetical protein
MSDAREAAIASPAASSEPEIIRFPVASFLKVLLKVLVLSPRALNGGRISLLIKHLPLTTLLNDEKKNLLTFRDTSRPFTTNL